MALILNATRYRIDSAHVGAPLMVRDVNVSLSCGVLRRPAQGNMARLAKHGEVRSRKIWRNLIIWRNVAL